MLVFSFKKNPLILLFKGSVCVTLRSLLEQASISVSLVSRLPCSLPTGASILVPLEFQCLYHIKQDLSHGFNITILNSKIKIIVVQISYQKIVQKVIELGFHPGDSK